MGREIWKPGNMLYPVPAVMVSCARPGETPNIITVAWTGTICSDPAMLYISVKKSRYSHDIIKETSEFVVNLVGEEQVRAADWCGVRSGKDFDKFKETGLTAIGSSKIHTPSIEQCPVSIECRVSQILELGSHDMFLANVLAVTVDDRYIDENGKLHLDRAGLTTYSHGQYFGLGQYKGKFGFSVEKKKKNGKKR